MRSRFSVLGLVLFMLGCASAPAPPMSQASLAEHIQKVACGAQVSRNVVQFEYAGVSIASVSDATHDRMRLITPIAKVDSLQPAQLEVLLVANFHTTLDARYALSEGVVYAAFLHPLSTLSRPQLESAIRQVSALSLNFGSTYSSGELIYGVESGEEV